MTAIQAESLPVILSGKDLLAQAKTGSGKTAAFAIGILHRLEPRTYQTQALVLCPTRELADQVSKEFRRLARAIPNTNILTLCGGKPIAPQLASLERNPHIVVGTPGRVQKHIDKGTLALDGLKTLVLDEADRMLDMGFYDDIMRIIDNTPDQKQSLLFSATYPDGIKKISKAIQNNPSTIHVESLHDDKKIEQIFYEIDRDTNTRTKVLITLLQHHRPESCVIFCNRKQQCQDLANDLEHQGFNALALHGDLEQKQRDQVLIQFSNNSSSILIATDVAARGLDIKDLQAVINFELPHDPDIYIHRIGRTGRADKKGLALSLYMPSETTKIIAIEDYQKVSARIDPLDSLKPDMSYSIDSTMTTLEINGGRKDKVRAGDILGALTADKKLTGKQIGKIDLLDKLSYVAVEKKVAQHALNILHNGKIKGRKFKARKLS